MLSPNATKRVALSLGGTVTVTVNVHESVRCRWSVAVQLTLLGPTGKVDPLAGTQEVATGDAPAIVVALPYTTEIGVPSGDDSEIGAGQVIFGGSGTGGGGGVGCDWVPLQP
jgi:hypothetical protein